PSLLLQWSCGDDQLLGVPRVKEGSQHSRPGLGARVPGHPVEAPGRLVERLADLEPFGRLIVDRMLVLSLQDVSEHRARVTVRWTRLARFERYLHHCCPDLLPVQLLQDIPLGKRPHL